jgi:hypothetical protein
MEESVTIVEESISNIEKWVNAFDQVLLDAGMSSGFEILL